MIIDNLRFRFKSGLIGFSHDEELLFIPKTDGKKEFEENCKKQPINWIYRNNPIIYKNNSLGFRCIDHTMLEDNYILYTGCSYTQGIGLHLENTYPYIVSQQLNKTYYNLALGGTGIDMVKNNLIMFLSLMKNKLPEYIIIQWPSKERSFLIRENDVYLVSPHSDEMLFKTLIEDDKITWTNNYNKFYILEFLKKIGIKKIIEIGTDNGFYNNTNPYNNIIVPNVLGNGKDYARDLSHPGNLGHKLQAEEILDAIKTM